jgi:hypothetical protein
VADAHDVPIPGRILSKPNAAIFTGSGLGHSVRRSVRPGFAIPVHPGSVTCGVADVSMSRRSLAWGVAMPSMAAGVFTAHWFAVLFGVARVEPSNEGAERVSTGGIGHLTLLVGFVAALLLVALGRWFVARRGPGPSAGWFLVLPPLAFVFTELAERVFGVESLPFQAALEPRLAWGLALQVPFGLAAYVVARLALRAVEKVVSLLRRRRARPPRRRAEAPAWIWVLVPRVPVLALGYPQRGPPGYR